MDMNEGLDCNGLQEGQEVCIGVKYSNPDTVELKNGESERPPLTFIEESQNCSEFFTVIPGTTCYSISVAYHLNLAQLHKTYDCDHLTIGDTICVSHNNTCQHRYTVREHDTCFSIGIPYKLEPWDLEKLNEDLKCENLEIGRKICVWSANQRHLENSTCTIKKILEKDSTCSTIAHDYSITIDELQFLNPTVPCATVIPKGTPLCLSSESTVTNCSSILPVPTNSTCSKLADSNSMSVSLLMSLNPTLNCEKLNKTAQFCAGIGYFKSHECTDTVRINPETDSCQKIQNQTGLNFQQIQFLNPFLDCSKSLKWSSLICISSLGMDTRIAQQKIVKEVVPNLEPKYQEYLKNPSAENSEDLFRKVTSNLLKPDVNQKMRDLYQNSEDVKKILDSQHPLPRSTYCEQARKMTTSDEIKECICDGKELMVYCQALAIRRYQEKQLLRNVQVSRRSKRGIGCNFVTPLTNFKKNQTALDKISNSANSCWGGECTIPAEFIEISLEGKLCTPIFSNIEGSKQVRICMQQEDACHDANPDDAGMMKKLAATSTSAKAKLCIVGSKIVEDLTKFDIGLCYEIIAVDYFGLVGKLNVGTSLNLLAVKFSGGATIKVHAMAYPEMCKDREVECEDYCKWQDWPMGKTYGFINIKLLAILGFSGWTLFEKQFNAPDRLGCEVGVKAAVIFRNDRTCENLEERGVWRCCWSGKGKCTFELMEQERGFSFGESIWGNTLFVCEFFDRKPDNIKEKIGFDVFGGTSHNKGLKNFYYVAKNDGMYFGTVKYKEDQLIEKWKNPCVEAPPPKETPSDTEPSGENTVPANQCGKRIVGYYTGWGDREITENQLRKLTHVIFAFVAMKEDGSVDFGPVSEDDAGPEAGEKAKRRFLDMKKKARSVNTGVYILFAVGGWDNSQYYPSMAADSKKRANFINSAANFIQDHGIDGVDLDWEYPDSKGSDKKNQVTLLRELREKLDDLQKEKSRKSKFLISLATAAGEWNLRDGYDLEGVLKYADFLNIMTYDYYGAWASKWGAYTGPPAPLYFGSLKGFSGKLNADFTMKFYACKTKKPEMLNMGVPFYGRFWKNVLGPIDGKDEMWRTAQEVGGKFEGGYVGWRNLEKEGWNKGAASWHEKTKTPYILNSAARMFLGFENERSLKEKTKYATQKNLGGLMIWALDLDDDADTLLSLVSSAPLCSGGSSAHNFFTKFLNPMSLSKPYICNPVDDVRWWTPENSDETVQGQCGKSAKLINGYYSVCDPDDPGFSCCGAAGYCGSEKEYCGCETCVDYRKNPMLIVKEPVKPSREVQWYSMSDVDGKRGRCGKEAPLLNGKIAICNPDDDSKHCCSNGGYCGIGKEFCECDGCVDYKKKQ